jgi:choline kinase
MRGVILVAGVASRLRPLTNDVPKCLLPVGGISLLERTVGALRDSGITDLVIVTGYRAPQVREFMTGRFPGIRATYLHNTAYETTNNIASLWLAHAECAGREFLLLDGDILFDRRVVGHLLAADPGSGLVLRSRGVDLGEEEIKVEVNAEGFVRRIGKEISPGAAAGESIGIEHFAPDESRILFREVEELVVAQGRSDIFYETAFQRGIDRGMALRAVDIGDLPCMEIDTAEDLARAEMVARRLLR